VKLEVTKEVKEMSLLFPTVHDEQEGARQEAVGGHRAQAAEDANLAERRILVEQQCKLKKIQF